MPTEKLLSLAEAAKWLEEELGLKRDKQTIHGWLFYSRRGIKLEVVSVAGTWYTSREAIKRFISATTKQHSDESGCHVNELRIGPSGPGAFPAAQQEAPQDTPPNGRARRGRPVQP